LLDCAIKIIILFIKTNKMAEEQQTRKLTVVKHNPGAKEFVPREGGEVKVSVKVCPFDSKMKCCFFAAAFSEIRGKGKCKNGGVEAHRNMGKFFEGKSRKKIAEYGDKLFKERKEIYTRKMIKNAEKHTSSVSAAEEGKTTAAAKLLQSVVLPSQIDSFPEEIQNAYTKAPTDPRAFLNFMTFLNPIASHTDLLASQNPSLDDPISRVYLQIVAAYIRIEGCAFKHLKQYLACREPEKNASLTRALDAVESFTAIQAIRNGFAGNVTEDEGGEATEVEDDDSDED
jgi:hypothetical protein